MENQDKFKWLQRLKGSYYSNIYAFFMIFIYSFCNGPFNHCKCKNLLPSVIQSLLVIFAVFSDWKSAAGTPSENKEHDNSAIDLTTGCKAAQTVGNLPQDLSLVMLNPRSNPMMMTLTIMTTIHLLMILLAQAHTPIICITTSAELKHCLIN